MNEMNEKIIICLYAPSDKGKTKSIRRVHELLGGDAEVRANSYDIVDELDYKGVKIGIESAGDPDSEQAEAIEKLMNAGCPIIIAASRTRGVTVDVVIDLSNQYGYTIIWISPLYGHSPLTDASYIPFADANAKEVVEIIDKLINGITI